MDGSPTDVFQVQKGLRQGNSLSPILFVMAIEYLSRLIKLVVKEKRLDVYINGGVEINPMLAFVVDVTFFCRASRKSELKIHFAVEVKEKHQCWPMRHQSQCDV